MSDQERQSPLARAAPVEVGLVRAFLLVMLPFSLGYYLSYLYRAVNAVIAPQLTSEIGLTASDLGFLTATYFLATAAVQLPLGVLLDRFGPRLVQGGLLAIAAVGALLFSLGDDMPALVLARALIGLGVSATLTGSFKAVTLWFPQRRWPLVNGFFLAMGGVGAMSATAPVEALLHVLDWRAIFLGLAVLTLAVAVLIVAVVPDRRGAPVAATLTEQALGTVAVFGSRFFWRVAPLCVVSQATGISIQTLWAGPWFRDVAGLTRDGVAAMLLVTAAAMTAGFIGVGLVADVLERRGVPLLAIVAGGVGLFMMAVALVVFAVAPTSPWPWLAFGLFSNTGLLCHPLLTRAFPLGASGRVFTSLNLLVILGAFAAQYGIGVVIDLWPTSAGGGYAREAYRAAFGGLLACQAAAWLWFLLPGGKKDS